MPTTLDALSGEYLRSLVASHPSAISLLDEVTAFYGETLTIRRAQVSNDLSGYVIAVDAPNPKYDHTYLNLNTSTDRVTVRPQRGVIAGCELMEFAQKPIAKFS
jgi:hypothetical protein